MKTARFEYFLRQHRLLNRGDKVIVGCSAGPDSTALVHLLCGCNFDLQVIAVYIDHGLRPGETPREKELVAQMAGRLHTGYEAVAVDAAEHRKKHGASLEESCRLLRYHQLEICRRKYGAEAIAVAHTADDQAEEIFLRLIRGTGLKGLSGMRPRRGKIIRPLLWADKEELLDSLHAETIPYCIDSSNSDTGFLRNRLRLDILPAIREHFNPALTSTLSQTADILTEDDDLLDHLTLAAMEKCCVYSPPSIGKAARLHLDIASLARRHLALRRRIIEKIMWRFGVKASFRHIGRTLDLSEQPARGKEIHLPRGLRVYRGDGQLVFEQPWGKGAFRGSAASKTGPSIKIDALGEYRIGEYDAELRLRELSSPPETRREGELLVDAAKISWPLVLRPPRPGERFSPPGLQGSKKVARFLSDLKIPRQQRMNHPLVTADNLIIGVAGLQIDRRSAPGENTERFLLISWQRRRS